MALRKGKVKENDDVVAEEVAGETATKEAEKSDDMPFAGGSPVDEVESTPSAKETPPTDKEMAEAGESHKAVAEAPRKGGVLGELAEDGFEGLELGFGSFPIIVLKTEGEFEDTEGTSYDEDFECILQGTRNKYIIKNTKCTPKEEEVIYSYDGKVEAENGHPVQDTIDEWAEQGWGYETKSYLEVTALLVGEDGEADNMVLLSVPPTSTKKLSGFIAQNRMRRRLLPSQYVTRCVVGDKITNVDFPFYPWKFEFVKAL